MSVNQNNSPITKLCDNMLTSSIHTHTHTQNPLVPYPVLNPPHKLNSIFMESMQ